MKLRANRPFFVSQFPSACYSTCYRATFSNPLLNFYKKINVHVVHRPLCTTQKFEDEISIQFQQAENLFVKTEGKADLEQSYKILKEIEQRKDFNNSEIESKINYLLGSLLLHENLQMYNKDEGKKYIKKSAEQGFATAEYILGIYLLNSNLFDKNIEEGLAYLHKASKHGNPDATQFLGEFYWENCENFGIKKDLLKSFEYFKKAEEQGSEKSLHYLLYVYSHGIPNIMEPNSDKFKEIIMTGAKKSIPRFQYELGKLYLSNSMENSEGNAEEKNQEQKKGLELIIKAADAGELESKYILANFYWFGNPSLGIEKDKHKAISLWEDASNLGHAKSTYLLGNCYFTGDHVKQSFKKAIQLYLKASPKSFDAKFALANLYLSGNEYLEKNEKKGVELLEELSSKNHGEAQFLLSECYHRGIHVPKHPENRLFYLEKAAESGNDFAQYFLAIYWLEQKNQKNLFQINLKENEKALHLLQRSANKKNKEALNCLGKIYLNSITDEQSFSLENQENRKLAIRYLEAAAALNQPEALTNLSSIYFTGSYGLPKNEEKAVACLEKASELGFPLANFHLAAFYMEGIGGVKQDFGKAFKLLQFAAAQGLSDALVHLSHFYYDGIFVEKDHAKARFLLESAAAKGNEIATKLLQPKK